MLYEFLLFQRNQVLRWFKYTSSWDLRHFERKGNWEEKDLDGEKRE
jgi:hypothetical protein